MPSLDIPRSLLFVEYLDAVTVYHLYSDDEWEEPEDGEDTVQNEEQSGQFSGKVKVNYQNMSVRRRQ